MGDLAFKCPSVPVIRGSEVRFSIDESRIVPISDWPLAYVSCGEITPDQPRQQFGMSTYGDRYDSFSGFRLGSEDNNLTLGARTTYTSSLSPTAALEQQRVGVASLTLGGDYQFRYWNDHGFWWWPMGDGGDQGDTAGVQFSYNLGGHNLHLGNWRASSFNITMRLATGIPNANKTEPTSAGRVYTEVDFPMVQRGDLSLSANFYRGSTQRLEMGFTVDTSALGHAVQNVGIHRPLDIPEFKKFKKVEVMFFLRIVGY